MKKRIVYVIIYALVLMLMMAAEASVIWSIVKLGMIPDLYVWILVGFFALLSGGIAVLLFVHRKGQWIGAVRQIIACVLIAAVIAGCCFVVPKVNKLHTTVEQITTNQPVGPSRNVYVRMEDPAETIQDAAGYTFAALTLDEYCTQQVCAALEQELQATVSVQYFDNESLMITAFYNQEVGALILNEGYLSIWEENELFQDFHEKTRLLYCVPVEENSQSEQQATEPEPEPVADITNTPFILYVSGMDGYSKILARTRSDVNILMVVNPVTKQILMINTPRDYYVVHPWGRGSRDKLTHCGVYGIDCSVDALELLYEVPVNYYAQINFTGFETLIDAIGGVTVYSDNSFYGGDFRDIYIPKGEVEMDGKTALAFARDRYHQSGGDNDRGKNQMKVIQAVIAKVTSGRTLIANYTSILSSLEGMLATSVPMEDLSKLVKMQLTDMASWNILSYAVTGYGDTRSTYSSSLASYVMVPNQSTVDHAKQLIQRVIDGEVLTQEDMTVPKN